MLLLEFDKLTVCTQTTKSESNRNKLSSFAPLRFLLKHASKNVIHIHMYIGIFIQYL